MKKHLKHLLLLGSVLILQACSKVGGPPEDPNIHVHDDNDDVPPIINVIRPSDNQQYQNGDTIFIQGSFTDNKKLYKGYIRITDDANGLVVNEQFIETHVLQAMPFDFYQKTAVTIVSNYTIKILMEDHGANITTNILKVKVNP